MRTLLGTFLAAASAMAADVPHGLTVEYRTDPVGMDTARPRLSWKVPDGGARNVTQAAYRVRVATSAARLAAPDAWDSGEVAADQSLNVVYAGKPLEPSREYFWTVETIDNHGRRAVSQPARWRTGLLRPENWAAKWITINPSTLEEYDLKGAAWVATNGTLALAFAAEAGDLDPRAAQLTHVRDTWRPAFEVGETKPAVLACAAEAAFAVKVNGRTVMKLDGGPLLRYVDIAGHLKAGTNAVDVAVKGNKAFIATLSLPGGRTFATGRDGWGVPDGARAACALPFRTVEKVSPAFRKTFRTAKPVRQAVLHITGLGFYEATLDGARIG